MSFDASMPPPQGIPRAVRFAVNAPGTRWAAPPPAVKARNESSSDDDDAKNERKRRLDGPDSGSDSAPEDDEKKEEVASLSSILSMALASDFSQRQELLLEAIEANDTFANEEKPIDATASRGLQICCICGEKSMYTCPGCQRKTCSLTCIRVHKAEHHCSGQRDVASFVPVNKFDDTQLRRDFYFLEDCRRALESSATHRPRDSLHYTYAALPPPLHALREAAKKRGVLCQLVSEGMKKRDENTTRFDKKTDTMIWRCEFRVVRDVEEFVACPSCSKAIEAVADASLKHTAAVAKNFAIATNWGSERYLLGDIFLNCYKVNPPLPLYHVRRGYSRASRWVKGDLASRVKRNRTDDLSSGEDDDGEPKPELMDDQSSMRHEGPVVVADDEPTVGEKGSTVRGTAEMLNESKLKEFLNECHQQDYTILYKAERLGSRVLYFQMNPNATLHENLRTVFFVNEFPVFYVVRDEDLFHFEIVSDDDKERIRESFRKKERPTFEQKLAALPKKSDLDPNAVEMYSRIPCRQFLRGNCMRAESECPYWHCTASEVPACRNMLMSSQCAKGSKCSFSHDAEVIAREKRDFEAHGRGRGRGRGRGGGERGRGNLASASRTPQREPIRIPYPQAQPHDGGDQ